MDRPLLRPLMLAALLYTGAAHATAPYLETSAFTLQGRAGYPDSVVTVLSDTAQAITLSLPTLAQLSTAVADSLQEVDGTAHVSVAPELIYDIHPRAGFLITGINLAATVQGGLSAADGDFPGFAYNVVVLSYEVLRARGAKGQVISTDLQTEQQFTMTAPQQWLYSDFGFYLRSYVNLMANSGVSPDPLNGDPVLAQSLAFVTMRDVTLTFTVAPVPEPQTWLLMLGGLAAIAAAGARSRKRD